MSLRNRKIRDMKRFYKIIALVLTVSLLLPLWTIKAQEDKVLMEEQKEYVVVAKSKEEGDKIKRDYVTDTGKYTECMEEANITLNTMSEQQAEKLNDKKDIIVEENFVLEGCGKTLLNPEDVSCDWNIRMINADKKNYSAKLRKKIKKGKKETNESDNKVKIAIIDSGVDESGDINIKERYNLVPGEETISPCFEDNTGHGTSIAGIIGSKKDDDTDISGINPNAEIYSIKVMDTDNTAPVSRIIEAIYKAIEYDVDIINMSFGTTYNSDILHKAIRDANDKGILLVAAAGNRGCEDGTVEYPAAYSEVIAVGAVDTSAELAEESSRGEDVDVLAPGEAIKTLSSFGNAMNQCLVFDSSGNVKMKETALIGSKQVVYNNVFATPDNVYDRFLLFRLYSYAQANRGTDTTFATYEDQLAENSCEWDLN